MNPQLQRDIALALQEERLRKAEQRAARAACRIPRCWARLARALARTGTPRPGTKPLPFDGTLALRMAEPDEYASVARLAALNGTPPLYGRVALGILDGRIVAALAIASGRAVADPFTPTQQIVALLRRAVSETPQ